MDFVNKIYRQASELFRSLTPAARLTTGVLLAAVVISLVYLFNHRGAGPDAFLMGGEPIPASQLPAMEAAFAKAGLTNYEIEGNRIRVPRGQQAVFMGALADGGAMPQNFGSFLRSTVERTNPFTPKAKQAEMTKVATQEELALILRSMKDIENASVLYDTQMETGPRPKKTVTASVSVKPVGSAALNEERVPAIRNLIAGAIAGLAPENVAVTDLNSARFFPTGAAGKAAMGDSEYNSAKLKYETGFSEKIRAALAYVPGVVVTTNVELSKELNRTEVKNTIDPKAVPSQNIETTRTTKSQSAPPGGRPGLAGQGGISGTNTPATINGVATTTETEETDSKQHNIYGNNQTKVEIPGLVPQRVTVSVGIPSSYYDKIWRETHPTPAGEEPKPVDAKELAKLRAETETEIQKMVAHIIPSHAEAVDNRPQVAVSMFQSLTTPALPTPGISDHAVAFLGQHWGTLGMCCLGLFSLVMLRSMLKASPTPSPAMSSAFDLALSASTTSADEPAKAAGETPAANSSARLKRKARTGPTLRDELVEIVREDPDGAASILRSWIGSAT